MYRLNAFQEVSEVISPDQLPLTHQLIHRIKQQLLNANQKQYMHWRLINGKYKFDWHHHLVGSWCGHWKHNETSCPDKICQPDTPITNQHQLSHKKPNEYNQAKALYRKKCAGYDLETEEYKRKTCPPIPPATWIMR